MLGARLSSRIAQCPDDLLLERRGGRVLGNRYAGLRAPRCIGQLLGGRVLAERVTGDRRGQRGAARQERTPVKKTVAGSDVEVVERGVRLLV